MVYRVLFIEKDSQADKRAERVLTDNGCFYLDIVPPDKFISTSDYNKADCVVAHMSTRRTPELVRLRRENPDVNVLFAPTGHIGNVHSELGHDADGVYFLGSGFTEQNLIIYVSQLAALSRRKCDPVPVY